MSARNLWFGVIPWAVGVLIGAPLPASLNSSMSKVRAPIEGEGFSKAPIAFDLCETPQKVVHFPRVLEAASSGIRFISAAASRSNTLALGPHEANDIIFMTAARLESTPCSLPPGWVSLGTSTAQGFSTRFAYKIATSSNETCGTWLNSSRLVAAVYRGQSRTAPLGGGLALQGSGTAMSYGNITMRNPAGSSWVIASGSHENAITISGQTAPAPMVNRAETGATSGRTGADDTNGGVPAWASRTVSASGWGNWATYVLELIPENDDTTGPSLSVVAPVEGQVFTNSPIPVRGTAADPSGIAQVSVNGVPASGTTNWSSSVALVPGPNLISITATDAGPATNRTTQMITVFYNAPESGSPGIRFISAAASRSNRLAFGPHQANDIIFMTAARLETAPCSLPPGWTPIASSTAPGFSTRFAYKIAASSAETSGTWTNSARLVAAIYRGQSRTAPLGTGLALQGSGTVISYGGLTLKNPAGSSWVIASGSHENAISLSGQVPPSTMVNRAETGATSARTGMDDTNGGVPAWTTRTVSASGWGNWATYILELVPEPDDRTPPDVSIAAPVEGQVFTTSPIAVSGFAADPSGIALVTVNGVSASGTTSWSSSVPLVPGANLITVTVTDGSTRGNQTNRTLNVFYNPPDATPPALSIVTPVQGQVFTTSPIPITGTATHPSGIARITVNGTLASGTTQWSSSVALIEGVNTITVTATDNTAAANETTQTLMVIYTAPESVSAGIRFISAAASGSSTLAFGPHQANDIIFMTAARLAVTPCSLPPGWTPIATSSAPGFSTRFAYKIAKSSNEVSGTWTNSTRLVAAVYRGQNRTAPLGGWLALQGSGTALSYGGITLTNAAGSSWVIASGSHQNAITTSGQTPPATMVNRAETGETSPRTGAHDSDGGVLAWTNKSVPASGSGNWATYVLELVSATDDTTAPVAGNSGVITTADVYDTSLTLNWAKATDSHNAQSLLRYQAFVSLSDNISTVAGMESNGTPLNDYTSDIATWKVGNLLPNTTYYFNLIVKDIVGNKAAYTTKMQMTQEPCLMNVLTDFSAGSVGTPISGGLLNASTFGTSSPNWMILNPSPNFMFSDAAHHTFPGSMPLLCVNPYPGDFGSVGAALLVDNTLQHARFTFPSSVADTVTAGYWFKSDYPSTQSGVDLDTFDIIGIGGFDFVNVQFHVFNGSQRIGIETGSAGGCTHPTQLISIQPNTWYWITLQYTAASDRQMRMNVYDENLRLVAALPTDGRTPCSPTKPGQVRFGHIYVTPPNNLPGRHLYFDKVTICYLGSCAFPLMPPGAPNP